MGLDITAFSHAVRLSEEDKSQEDLWNDGWKIVNAGFHGIEAPLELGAFYNGKNELSFRAGSYSGYNDWRAWLCFMALNCAPDDVWAHPECYAGKSFVELINFSDCEGIIGSTAAKKLAGDFANWQHGADKIKDVLIAHKDDLDLRTRDLEDNVAWFRKQYTNWRLAMEFAAQDGFVAFH